MKRHERLLCCLLKCALLEKPFDMEGYTDDELDNAVKAAIKHSVFPLLYDVLSNAGRVTGMLESVSLQTVQQSYHLLFLSKYVVDLILSKENYCCIACGVIFYLQQQAGSKAGGSTGAWDNRQGN